MLRSSLFPQTHPGPHSREWHTLDAVRQAACPWNSATTVLVCHCLTRSGKQCELPSTSQLRTALLECGRGGSIGSPQTHQRPHSSSGTRLTLCGKQCELPGTFHPEGALLECGRAAASLFPQAHSRPHSSSGTRLTPCVKQCELPSASPSAVRTNQMGVRHHGPPIGRALPDGLQRPAKEPVGRVELPAADGTARTVVRPLAPTNLGHSNRPKRAHSRLAANLWLAACLVLALAMCLSPFIGGASRRLTHPSSATSTRQAIAAARATSPHAAALAAAASHPVASKRATTGEPSAADALDAPQWASGGLGVMPAPVTGDFYNSHSELPSALSAPERSDAVLTLSEGEADPAAIQYLYRPIEDLREGDLVVATDPGTGETRLARVVQTFQRITYHLRHLVLEDSAGGMQQIETTDEHPFFVPSVGDFVPAGKLRVGDTLRGPLGEPLYVIETRYEEHREGIAVYNFEVETYRTYLIAASVEYVPVLVHNRCNNWNEFQKATKGQFRSRTQAAAVWRAWNRGTFSTKLDSIMYHWQKHGKGRDLVQYTSDALQFWNTHRAAAVWGQWRPTWAPSFRLRIGWQGGYFTANGEILTYWD